MEYVLGKCLPTVAFTETHFNYPVLFYNERELFDICPLPLRLSVIGLTCEWKLKALTFLPIDSN